jgi:hypothetical protein
MWNLTFSSFEKQVHDLLITSAYLTIEENTMKKNVGGIDRVARLVIGPVLILVGIAGYAGLLTLAVGPLPQALTAVMVFLVGTILLVTGFVQKCPLNRVLGLNTHRREGARESEERPAINQK